MAQFNVEPVQRFAHMNAAIKRPREVTFFSFDEDHKFRLDDSSLRYYYPPNLAGGIDLSKGFESFRQLDDANDEHLDGLLDAIVAHEQDKNSKLETDIITWRGMMTKIMTVPYSNLDDWEMNATLFEGTIFIEENHQKKLSSRSQQFSSGPSRGNMSQELMSFWGYKFETLCLLRAPWAETPREYIETREEQVVSNYAQYCSIVRTGFGKTKIVIGGEVDAVMAFKPTDKTTPTDWVELKTSAEVTNDRERTKFERKLLKFWAQSFLLGVPKIIVGYRTQQGRLQRLEELDTQAIPETVQRRGNRLWDGQICINFASSFLEWLKATITTDGVWRIQRRAKEPVIRVFKTEETGTGDILSQNFLSWRARLRDQESNKIAIVPSMSSLIEPADASPNVGDPVEVVVLPEGGE
ncbi:hypothetical protein DV737_g262, partial [Chaetothyriales sp. CBS 132003]